MPYSETKVYFDGSHYIAIPHTTRPNLRRKKLVEEVICVVDKANEDTEENMPINGDNSNHVGEANANDIICDEQDSTALNKPQTAKIARTITRKELFEELYAEFMFLPYGLRRKEIVGKMRPFFENEEAVEEYVTEQLERKNRNLICRRIRCVRKQTYKTLIILSPLLTTIKSIVKRLFVKN